VGIGVQGTMAMDLEGTAAGSKSAMVLAVVWAIPTCTAVDLSMAQFAVSVCTTF